MNESKKYLYTIKYLDQDIERTALALKTAEIRLTSVGGVRYDKQIVQSSGSADWREELLDHITELKLKQAELIQKKWERLIITQGEIMRLDNETYRFILSRYFLDSWSIQKIARSLETTEAAVYQQYSRALKQFAEANAEILGKYQVSQKGHFSGA